MILFFFCHFFKIHLILFLHCLLDLQIEIWKLKKNPISFFLVCLFIELFLYLAFKAVEGAEFRVTDLVNQVLNLF